LNLLKRASDEKARIVTYLMRIFQMRHLTLDLCHCPQLKHMVITFNPNGPKGDAWEKVPVFNFLDKLLRTPPSQIIAIIWFKEYSFPKHN
jgi:hypothetical protein